MPSSYQICSKTVMDTSDSSIRFDDQGISNHYWDFHNNVNPNWHPNEIGNSILTQQIKRIKRDGKGKPYDCILGLSGGLDSSYMLHKLVRDFNLRPLLFHVDAGWNTDTAVQNINSLINVLNLDLFTEVVNWRELRDFQLALFKSGLPTLDLPQDLAFIGVLYKYAVKHDIKYIFNGGNIATESVYCPLDILYYGTDMFHVRALLKRFGTVEMKSFPFSSLLNHKVYMRFVQRIKVVKPLNYIPFNKSKAISELQDIYNWKPYPQKHFESRFTRFYEGFWLPSRFNFDMRRIQLSSLILSNQISRDSALDILSVPSLTSEFAQSEFEYVASKLDISTSKLHEYFTMPLKYYYDYPNMKRLISLGERVYMKLFKSRRGGAF